MQLAFAHSTSATMVDDAGAPHRGHWRFDLDDGTFFHVIRCSHAGTMALHLKNHAPTALALPAARSSKPLPDRARASLERHLATSVESTYAALEAMFARHGDPMLDPDSAT